MAELGTESKLQLAVCKLGISNGVPRPEFVAPKGNNDPQNYVHLHNLAWEYFVSSIVKAAAEKRHDAAKKACDSAGMWAPALQIAPGSSAIIHDTPDLTIMCEKKNPATRIDSTVLRNELSILLGGDEKKLDAFMKKVTKTNAPATSYKVMWKD